MGQRDLAQSVRESGLSGLCRQSEDQGQEEEYLGRVMRPLTIHKELVLMLSFRQVQDGYKVIVAAREKDAEAFSWVSCPPKLTDKSVVEQNPTFPCETKSSAAK